MEAIDKDLLVVMRMRVRRNPGTRWAAYENRAWDSSNAGHVQCLLVGTYCTYAEPPRTFPQDNEHGMGWRYLFAGFVNLDDGTIEILP